MPDFLCLDALKATPPLIEVMDQEEEKKGDRRKVNGEQMDMNTQLEKKAK